MDLNSNYILLEVEKPVIRNSVDGEIKGNDELKPKVNDIKCNSFEAVVRTLLDNNYYKMSKSEKKEVIERKASANAALNCGVRLEDTDFVLDNEVTYILSLLKYNIVYLLERADNRVLTKDIDVPELPNNYVFVNKFADELLNNYQKREEEDRGEQDV